MIYRFTLQYTPTDGEAGTPRDCFPSYSNDLAISIERESNQWYYKRKLDGNLTFLRTDYNFIMGCPFDGTFTLTIYESHDNGAHFTPYFEGSFSRANLSIDEDNRSATISSFIEGVYNAIENGKNEEFDLMKIIPDSELKTVHGQVNPALALVDYRGINLEASDLFCGTALTSGGYKENLPPPEFDEYRIVADTNQWRTSGVLAEAEITKSNGTKVKCGGILTYPAGHYVNNDYGIDCIYMTIGGTLVDIDGNQYPIGVYDIQPWVQTQILVGLTFTFSCPILGIDDPSISINIPSDFSSPIYFSPLSLSLISGGNIRKIDCIIHYIRTALLTGFYDRSYQYTNCLNVGDMYKGMNAFEGSGLQLYVSSRTVDQPNGHRIVPGSDEMGNNPVYFAPPDEVNYYIPLAEYEWYHCSFWYKILPSVSNGLLDPSKVYTFERAKCYSIGTCIRYLLKRITNDKVVFSEDANSSHFLYESTNPVTGKFNYTYLVTQKSNMMKASGNAARCIVRLNWFLELLRNAFNCYYWLEPYTDGKHLFRVEHVEYFRKGGRYSGDLDHSIDLTSLFPLRNFSRNNRLVKRLSDKINRYDYDLQGMAEKYTFSWQGDGGSDDFKGNPMFFKAGWIETGTSENHQVDNIFTDLAWLLLNAGTDTASSKNHDGLFLFAGYHSAYSGQWIPGNPPLAQYLVLAQNQPMSQSIIINVTIPENYQIYLESYGGTIATFTGDGSAQDIPVNSNLPDLRLNFGSNYQSVTINNIIANDQSSSVFQIASAPNLLHPGNLQNGPLAWPWLQNDFLHYDIPALKWSFDSDDIDSASFLNTGTIKMVQKQEVSIIPILNKSIEDAIMGITGIRTAIEGGKTGIITNAKVNLSSRNAELTVVFNPIPQ